MRLNQVDRLILANSAHSYLTPNDTCFYFGEYTIRENWAYSKTNQLILNFKKIRSQCAPYEERHKDAAIRTAAQFWVDALSHGNNLAAAKAATLVPIPPSKISSDPNYDDRVDRMLAQISTAMGGLDVRRLVIQNATYQASHNSANRLAPAQLAANYTVNENVAFPAPSSIWIFDDTLVSGSHYRAMTTVLNTRFPNIPCCGMFLARGIFRDPL